MSQAAAVAKARSTKMKIMYKGQELRISARLHPSTGDLDLLEDVKAYEKYKGEEVPYVIPAGSRLITNRDLAARTNHATQYQCYTRGLYDRMRAGIHASQGYSKERSRLSKDEERVRFTSIQLLTQGASMSDPQLWTVRNIDPLIDDYRRFYDIRKIMAKQDMERGVKLTDSLGRRNIPAACFAQGSAIGNIQLRRKAIRFLESHVGREADQAAIEISAIRDAYRRLRYGFQPSYVVNWAYEDIGLTPPGKIPGPHVKGWLELARDDRTWSSLSRSLAWNLPFFEATVALPFRRNAAYVVRDIYAALAAIRMGDHDLLDEDLHRFQKGIHWFFALDHLEMKVVTPLSILMYDLEQIYKVKNPDREMAPREFDQILAQYHRFVGFVDLFRDGILEHPKQEEILGIVNNIAETLELDDWVAFKEQVLSITDIL
ncbi:MAG: hypothetical protein PHC70_00260 [Patescibacteria group bacterium]|nr:hypothetical protein [Patescibacteria group bacterium]